MADPQRASSGAAWLDSVRDRADGLDRAALHGEARALRAAAAAGLPLDQIPEDAMTPGAHEALLPHLDLASPRRALAWSFAVTDRALDLLFRSDLPPLRLAGVAGALEERALWCLPDGGGGEVENHALARRGGVYFTPMSVAWALTLDVLGPPLAEALDDGGPLALRTAARITVCDPSCGAGAFLVASWALLTAFAQEARARGVVLSASSVATTQLFGVDLAPRAVALARRLIGHLSGVESREVVGVQVGDAIDASVENAVDWRAFGPPGGFDVALLNPPFGRLRVTRAHYKERSRALRLTSDEAATLLKRRQGELAAVAAGVRADPSLAPALGGVLDWQRLFVVRALERLKPGGRLGALLPTGLVADRGTTRLRRHLLGAHRVEQLSLLPETAHLFPGVNQPTCLLVCEKGGVTTRFQMRRDGRGVEVSAATVQALSPSTWAIPQVAPDAWRVLAALARHGRLGDDPRVVNMRGELDLSVHRRFIGGAGVYGERLLRGVHVERFRVQPPTDARAAYVDKAGFVVALGRSKKRRHIERPRVVGRQCAFLEKPRRLSFMLCAPGMVVANSLNYLCWTGPDEARGLRFLLGLSNSALWAWRFGATSSNNHVNNYEIDDMPLLNAVDGRIVDAVDRLLDHWAARPFGASAQPAGPLEDALDAAVFSAYGLDQEAAAVVMSALEPNRSEAVCALVISSSDGHDDPSE